MPQQRMRALGRYEVTRLLAASLVLVLMALPGASQAGALPAPTGGVILTVRGNIEATNVDGTAQFDLAMLDQLPRRDVTTETPWYDGVHTFDGALLSKVLEAVGAHGKALRVVAINGYEATIPMDDVDRFPVILATRLDGKLLSIREKGPIFVVYPFDLNADLYNEVYYGRSVWQVQAIDVM